MKRSPFLLALCAVLVLAGCTLVGCQAGDARAKIAQYRQVADAATAALDRIGGEVAALQTLRGELQTALEAASQSGSPVADRADDIAKALASVEDELDTAAEKINEWKTIREQSDAAADDLESRLASFRDEDDATWEVVGFGIEQVLGLLGLGTAGGLITTFIQSRRKRAAEADLASLARSTVELADENESVREAIASHAPRLRELQTPGAKKAIDKAQSDPKRLAAKVG